MIRCCCCLERAGYTVGVKAHSSQHVVVIGIYKLSTISATTRNQARHLLHMSHPRPPQLPTTADADADAEAPACRRLLACSLTHETPSLNPIVVYPGDDHM
jgi:hypothetical protein